MAHFLHSRCSGQAAVEFIVGILLMMIVVSGIVHVNRMSRTSLFLHSVLRGHAGKEAMTVISSENPAYISNWQEGADELRYTADDQPLRNSYVLPATIDMLTKYSARESRDWTYVASDTRLPVSMITLHSSPIMASLVGFVHTEETLHVPVDTAIRELVYDKEKIAIKEEVWMPLTGGLY